jgi:hypothetical protein
MADTSTRSHLTAWLPVLVWAAVIWLLGGDSFSAPETSRILGPLIIWLWPDLDAETLARIVAGIRKLAHPGVYGLLAGLAFRAATRTAPARGSAQRAAIALLPVVALSIADEWRQSASTLRTGAPFDVALDLAGGLLVVALILSVEQWIGRRLFAPTSNPGSGPSTF